MFERQRNAPAPTSQIERESSELQVFHFHLLMPTNYYDFAFGILVEVFTPKPWQYRRLKMTLPLPCHNHKMAFRHNPPTTEVICGAVPCYPVCAIA